MKTKPAFPLLFALLLLAASSLACSINVNLGGPKTPTQQPTLGNVPTINPQELIQTVSPGKGEFSLEFTEAQLTEYLKEQLKKQSDPILQDPRVVLKDGQIEVYGTAQSGILSGNVHIAATVSVDDQGQPEVKITSATIGAIPIPSGLLDVFSKMLVDGLTSKLASYGTNFRLEDIRITDGLMMVKGQLQ